MPKYGADGNNVEEVARHDGQNWVTGDNTSVMLPSYLLTTDSLRTGTPCSFRVAAG